MLRGVEGRLPGKQEGVSGDPQPPAPRGRRPLLSVTEDAHGSGPGDILPVKTGDTALSPGDALLQPETPQDALNCAQALSAELVSDGRELAHRRCVGCVGEPAL